jgi:hypothetical protein
MPAHLHQKRDTCEPHHGGGFLGYGRWRSTERGRDLPDRARGRQTTRNLFSFRQRQRPA